SRGSSGSTSCATRTSSRRSRADGARRAPTPPPARSAVARPDYGLTEDRAPLLGGDPPEVAQVDLVVLARGPQPVRWQELLVEPSEDRAFVVEAAHVQGLDAEALVERLEPDVVEPRRRSLVPGSRD